MNDEQHGNGHRRFTIEEFERLPEREGRVELVRGRVVRRAPVDFRHGRIARRLTRHLRDFAREHELGEVVAGDTGFILAEDPPTVRSPDVAFLATGGLPEELSTGFGRRAPDLAVEIMTTTSTVTRAHEVVLDYLDAGTSLVWILEPAMETVTEWRSRDRIRLLGRDDHLEGDDVLPGFRLPVGRLFE